MALINKEKTLEVLKSLPVTLDAETVQRSIEAVSNMEEEQSELHWIPCSERLPEHGGWYIVTKNLTDGGDKAVFLSWYSFHGWEWGETPTAWIPLPEPYREEGDS